MKLYGHPFSTCTRKVLLTLAEKELQAEFVHIELSKGEQKNPEYLLKNPFGVVPFLEDGEIKMYESRAICRYLDAKSPQNKLTPTEISSRARMEQWTSVEHSYIDPAVGKMIHQKILHPMRGLATDLQVVESARKSLHFVFNILNSELRKSPYLAGEAFSLADLFIMPCHAHLTLAKEVEVMEAYPHFMNWWSRVSKRPSYKQFN